MFLSFSLLPSTPSLVLRFLTELEKKLKTKEHLNFIDRAFIAFKNSRHLNVRVSRVVKINVLLVLMVFFVVCFLTV